MLTYTLWFGTRSLISGCEYETITFDGEEIGAVEFADDDAIIVYRAFETEEGSIIVHSIVRQGVEVNADIDVYDNIETAAKEYRFLLRNTTLI